MGFIKIEPCALLRLPLKMKNVKSPARPSAAVELRTPPETMCRGVLAQRHMCVCVCVSALIN